jgi:hypothetical protein
LLWLYERLVVDSHTFHVVPCCCSVVFSSVLRTVDC